MHDSTVVQLHWVILPRDVLSNGYEANPVPQAGCFAQEAPLKICGSLESLKPYGYCGVNIGVGWLCLQIDLKRTVVPKLLLRLWCAGCPRGSSRTSVSTGERE